MADDQSKSKAVSFTPEIDKRIIEGFLGDQEAMMKELSRSGFSRSAILEREKKLGLTVQFIKNCQLIGTDVGDVAVRRCLGCNEPFASLGAHNRMCQRCQARS